MAEMTYTINVTDKQFNDLENCLSGNPEFLLFSTNLSDITLKVDLKQEKESMDMLEGQIQDETTQDMLMAILLTQKANYYKRLAEKIIDEKIKKY